MIEKLEFCTYCGKKMESERASKKFCNPQHRLYYHREVKRGTFVAPKIIDPDKYIKHLPNYQKEASIEIEDKGNFKKTSWDEPETHLVTFQELLNGMANVQFSDEKEDYAEKIRNATHLSEKQRNLLFTNLWAIK